MLFRYSAVLCAVLAPCLTQAAELHVGVGQPYTTIQSAIDDAFDDDVILIHDGEYAEALLIDGFFALTIEGVNGPDFVSIVAPVPAGTVYDTVEFTGSTSILRGVTVSGEGVLRSVLVGNNSDVWFENVVLENGIGADGYGGGNLDVFAVSIARMDGSYLIGGTANNAGTIEPNGGNARVEPGCDLTIVDSYVSGGIAEQGGGVHASAFSTLVIESTTIEDNHAVGPGDNDGGGLYGAVGSVVTASAVTFSLNEAGTDSQSEGAGAFVMSDTAEFNFCTFDSNLHTHKGGGIAALDGSVNILDSVFRSNRADVGGGFVCMDNPNCKVEGNWFEGNTAQTGGAGFTSYATVALRQNDVCQNTATGSGGQSGEGGGVFLDGGFVYAENNSFFENLAEDNGGAIRAQDGTVVSVNNNYIGNSSFNFGGAVNAEDGVLFTTGFNSSNDLVAFNWSTSSGGFAFGFGLLPETGFDFFWSNNPDAGTLAPLDFTSVVDTSDPIINGYIPGNCDPYLQRPQQGSPLLSAGNPLVFNPDGSRSHIGRFGGPQADSSLFSDGDGDGIAGLFDCVDTNADGSLSTPSIYFYDQDGDGLGGDVVVKACSQPVGAVPAGGDCDDWDASIVAPPTWYLDADGDGYGVNGFPVQSCSAPDSYVDNNEDCDDTDTSVNPGNAWYVDDDSDGYGNPNEAPEYGCYEPPGHVANNEDCNDSDPNVNPENWWYEDADHDGLGTGYVIHQACDPGDGYSVNNVDCDDTDNSVGGPRGWYVDADLDGYGDPSSDMWVSCDQLADAADNSLDCDDSDPTVYPDAPEYCDDVDHSCNGDAYTPEPVDIGSYFKDGDGDGAGDPATTVLSCEPREGLVEDGSDCDDSDPNAYPGAEEVWYNGVDNDCLGGSDYDQDGDGFESEEAIGGPDCNDTDAAVHPDALDSLDDDVDSDCNGVDARTWMVGGGGCEGCSQSGTGAGGWLTWVAILFAIRRRRHPAIG